LQKLYINNRSSEAETLDVIEPVNPKLLKYKEVVDLFRDLVSFLKRRYVLQEILSWYETLLTLAAPKYCGIDSTPSELAEKVEDLKKHLAKYMGFDPFNIDPKEIKPVIRKAYGRSPDKSPEHHRQFLREGWLEDTCKNALYLESIFGKGNFFIELQDEYNPLDRIPLTFQPIEVECLRLVSKETGIPAVASTDAHYARKEDSELQRLMLMTNMRTTAQEVEKAINSQGDTDVMAFFGSDQFYIHSPEEMKLKYTDEEIQNGNKASEMIEDFDISHEFYIPKAKIVVDVASLKEKHYNICNTDSDKELMFRSIEGLKNLKPWEKNTKSTKEDYWNQLIKELEMIFEYSLSDYILLTMDYCQFCRNRPANKSFDWEENLKNGGKIDPIPLGAGRGSAGGSLVVYATGITDPMLDPIKYGLKFYRFINPGRFPKGQNNAGDIDIDVSPEGREDVINYLKWKYGDDKVSQVITFGTIAARAAIKDVFRVSGVENGFDIANEITKCIPLEGSIVGEIQKLRESTGNENYGVLNWTLDHVEEMKSHYEEYKELIDKAVLIESTIRNTGKHASAIIIAPEALKTLCPMVLDTKTKQQIVGFSHKEAESAGLLKADILGLRNLSIIDTTEKLINV
jgi:DNA polymerase-3 subunit alpha